MNTKPSRTGRKIQIAVSMGDPAGVGPETILKAYSLLPAYARRSLTVFGDPDYFVTLDKLVGTSVKIIEQTEERCAFDGLRVVRTCSLKFNRGFGKVDRRYAEAAMKSVETAARATLRGEYGALVTAPINKESANLAGYHVAGHTEFLSGLCGGAPVAMLLASDKLKVVVATTHVAIKDVSASITRAGLVKLIKLVDKSLADLGFDSPEIAVCGLNPHASDGGLFGDEEKRIITPAVNAAKKAGVKVSGPYPADSMFTPMRREKYDVAIAMYHDQGLVPVKALGFGRTVNITLGLPFLRVSVDHGTAFDIAGRGVADGRPMAHAIMTAISILRGKYAK